MIKDEFHLRDVLFCSLHNLTGVQQALGHVTDVSTDYEMCQMLSKVVHDELEKIRNAIPEEWVDFEE